MSLYRECCCICSCWYVQVSLYTSETDHNAFSNTFQILLSINQNTMKLGWFFKLSCLLETLSLLKLLHTKIAIEEKQFTIVQL